MESNSNMSKTSDLTPKQELFCNEYLKDLNATQAAIRAKYSEKTARQLGSQLLSNVNIQEFIATLNQERLTTVKIDANFVLGELHKIANSSVKDMLNPDGTFKDVMDISDHAAKTIQNIEIDERVERDKETGEEIAKVKTVKLKLWSKDKSLENLGKHLKLFTEKMELSADQTLEQIIGNSMKGKK